MGNTTQVQRDFTMGEVALLSIAYVELIGPKGDEFFKCPTDHQAMLISGFLIGYRAAAPAKAEWIHEATPLVLGLLASDKGPPNLPRTFYEDLLEKGLRKHMPGLYAELRKSLAAQHR